MQMRIHKPVVVSTPAGLRHFVPGLTVSVSDTEAAQIERQQAGELVEVPALPAPKKKKGKKS